MIFFYLPESPFERARSGSAQRSRSRTFPSASKPMIPSMKVSVISRPTSTPTLPSFSQSANVINVTINYDGDDFKGIRQVELG
ncbi:hypothetical protein RhiirC2_789101 [Rhizophagus irregularis]|uniref:Uncharacterized protein n=1 Tax=Rhizophagus irregularis TaxID=588596 RepID=A0A2N1MNS8_9GLOM|nr:hypothetical protein RhiirC2_789101 [Rhizophagus irregularis]